MRTEIQDWYKRQALARDPANYGLSDIVLGSVTLPSARDIETKTVVVKGETVTFARRRPDTVWARLSAQLGPELVNAGEKLTEIYAEMHGLAGSPERDPGLPRGGKRDPTTLPNRMIHASYTWSEIMAGFGVGSPYPRLFTALCNDILNGGAAPTTVERLIHPAPPRDVYAWWDPTPFTRKTIVVDQPGRVKTSRWRHIVEATCQEPNRNAQATCVRMGCIQLAQILEAVGLTFE